MVKNSKNPVDPPKFLMNSEMVEREGRRERERVRKFVCEREEEIRRERERDKSREIQRERETDRGRYKGREK